MDRRTITAFIIIGLIIVLLPHYWKWISPKTQDTEPPRMGMIQQTEERKDGKAPIIKLIFTDNDTIKDIFYQIDTYESEKWIQLDANVSTNRWQKDWEIPSFDNLGDGDHVVYFKAVDNNGNARGQKGEWKWEFSKGLIEDKVSRSTSPDTLSLSALDTSLTEREVVIDTELYRAELTTRGGTIKSWQLKLFDDPDNEWVELLPQKEDGALGLKVNTTDYSNTLFSCDAHNIVLDDRRPVQSVEMALPLRGGERIVKKFTFTHGQYSINLNVSLHGFSGKFRNQKYELIWEPGIKSTEGEPGIKSQEKALKEDIASTDIWGLFGSKVNKFEFKKEPEDTYGGSLGWAGIRTKYFLMAMIPKSGRADDLRARREIMRENSFERKTFTLALQMPIESVDPTTHDYEIYLGPQDFNILKKYGVGLEECMAMGWSIIRPISRLILAFFVFMHRFIPNYGLVIIVFALLLKVLFYPLTHKQLEATRKMQELQPQLAALKEKYKKDPQRLNRETMALYKKAGANPLGGCFPLLLQMPVFFALYAVFRNTIELRRAEFVWWIKDLSFKDPYLILPIIMAVTMFIQQKMTMKDPKQAAMVYLMPAIMFFFFMNFASGLVLYWTVFQILSIVQQIILDRKSGKGSVLAKK